MTRFEKIYSLSETFSIAEELLHLLSDYHLWAFHGDLGSGKTTLIQNILKNLGSKDYISSPTFSLVNEYIADGKTIYHFDFYRINTPEEALDFGIYEYLDSGHLCLMEWPEMINKILEKEKVIHIYLSSEQSTSSRKITINF